MKRIIKEEKLKLIRERAAAKKSSTLRLTLGQLRSIIAEAILLEEDEGGDEGEEGEEGEHDNSLGHGDDEGYTEEEIAARHAGEGKAQDMR